MATCHTVVVVNSSSTNNIVAATPTYNINSASAIGGTALNRVIALEERVEIEKLFKVAETTDYTEYTLDVDGNKTNVDIWTDSGKSTKLFSKVNTYDVDGNKTNVSLTDEVTGKTITTTYTYDVDGNRATKTRSVT